MLRPGELAAVDDDTPERSSMAAQEFRQRVHDDIGPVVEWPEQDWSRHGVVYDQRDVVLPSDVRQRFKVADVAGRIANTLAEDGSCVFVDQPLYGGGMVAFSESNLDT